MMAPSNDRGQAGRRAQHLVVGVALGLAAPAVLLATHRMTAKTVYVENAWLLPVILLIQFLVGALTLGLCARWRQITAPTVLTMTALLALGAVLYPSAVPLGLDALPLSMIIVPGNIMILGGLVALWVVKRSR